MKSTFANLISDQGFELLKSRYFADLETDDIDYLYSYSQPCDNANLQIELDNCQHMSRLTLWESGQCCIEVISFRDGSTLINESSTLTSLNEFEEKLRNLISHMQASHKLH